MKLLHREIFVIGLLWLLVLAGCSAKPSSSEKSRSSSSNVIHVVHKAKSGHFIQDVSAPKLEEAIHNKETFVAYFSRDDCDECISSFPVILNFSEQKKVPILNVETRKERKNNRESISLLIKKYTIKSVPTLVRFKRGQAIRKQVGQINDLTLRELMKNEE